MKHGLVALTDLPWKEAAPRWRAVEELGFDHGWTYDHLVWEGLPDSPWRGALPTLAAAATLTSRIGLGSYVSSPNLRHPQVLLRDVQALHEIAGGRFLLGLGAGGTRDAAMLGAELTLGQRVRRFHEYVALYDRLRHEDHVDAAGEYYAAVDARTLPALGASVPMWLAANGPRSVALAAQRGDGWITYGGAGEDLEQWFAHVAGLVERFSAAEAAAGRSGVRRVLSLDSSPVFSLSSVALYEEMSGRAAELGFTDVVAHWPRPDGPYAGSERVLEEVAGRILR